MESRNVWNLHGLTGYFIAVAILLSAVGFLWVKAVAVQQATAQQAYEIKDPMGIKMIAPHLGNEPHVIVHGKPVAGDSLHKWQFVEK